jgi:hypothetical protein
MKQNNTSNSRPTNQFSVVPQRIAKSSVAVVGIALLGISSVHAQSFTFGSDNDGLAGFTQSPDNFYGGYTTNATNVEWFQQENNNLNGGPGGDTDGGLANNSLLRSFTLDRTNGSTYTIIGELTWSAEADRNNRQGIYLFGNSSTIPNEDEAGALSLHYQADAGQLRIAEGLDLNNNLASIAATGAPATNSLFSSPLIFEAVISFVDNGGTDEIDVAFTLFNDFDGDTNFASNTISLTVLAADYTGSFFGFAGRVRDDGDGNSVTLYESFSVIPEPSSFAFLLGVAGLGLVAARRRR